MKFIQCLLLALSFLISNGSAEESIGLPPVAIDIGSSPSTSTDQLLESRIFRLAWISPDEITYTLLLLDKTGKKVESKDPPVSGLFLMDLLAKFKGPDGTLSIDERTNVITAHETPDRLDRFQKIIDALDVPPPDITLEAANFVANTEGGG